MDKEQELEWAEAQKTAISVDLVAAAKRQLLFLAAVDRSRWLYEGPALQRAIYRYNACWLPLLAKHSECQVSEGPLIVPLDCEWIWHCHRLNPVRYKSDCERLYGRMLDNQNVVSSVQETSMRETEDIWNRLYPGEPYSVDLARACSDNKSENFSESDKYTDYDLVSAVKRQSPFFYQVSRPHLNNDIFLEEAEARYKGFLHLIKRNRERSIKRFCVPTYDIDLFWHTHQLHPVSYCKDMNKILGKILEHDDMDSDRTKGKKLDVGFSGTTKQWEETYGRRYWKAGAMYKGIAPAPVTKIPLSSNIVSKKLVTSTECEKLIHVPEVKVVEGLLEVVEVRNLPEGHKGNLIVLFGKKKPDTFFNFERRLTIFSEYGEKQVASFQCESTGELFFELHSPSNFPLLKPSKKMGFTSLSLSEFLAPVSKLSVEKWLDLAASSGNASSEPLSLRIAVSFTVPTVAPAMLHMVPSRPFSKSSCYFPLPGRIQRAKSWARVIDEAGSEIICLQMRDLRKEKAKDNCSSRKEVIGITKSGETCKLADLAETGWSLLNSHWHLQLPKKLGDDGHLFELIGNTVVKLYPGRKLDYEPKHCDRHRRGSEREFMTAVEFSAEYPYGKAVALLDLKSGFVKVNEEQLVLPGIVLAFILSDTLRKEGYDAFTANGENLEEHSFNQKVNGCYDDGEETKLAVTVERNVDSKVEVAGGDDLTPEKAGSRSGGCGGGCGSGCGGGCGGGCGNMVKSGGCGGCGGGCGGCGGGCGSKVNSGGCGGCGGCGGGCGNKFSDSVSAGHCVDAHSKEATVLTKEAAVA